jgi:hypothetical protein
VPIADSLNSYQLAAKIFVQEKVGKYPLPTFFMRFTSNNY